MGDYMKLNQTYNRWPERQILPLDIYSKYNLADDMLLNTHGETTITSPQTSDGAEIKL